MSAERLSQELTRLTEGMTPLEKALMVADAMRNVWGKDFVIEPKADGGFTVKRKD